MKIGLGCSGCFAGLACGARIEIVNLLKQKGRMSVLQIAKHFNLTQPTISHHLQYLQNAGVLDSKKEGQKKYYFVSPKCRKKDCNIFR